MQNKGKLFILSGPSGSGKDTILAIIRAGHPEIFFSISSITRNMRPGEVEGEKYHFISKSEFENMLKNDMLLEHNVFVGNYYGTPKKPVEDAINNGQDVILEIDVNGAQKVREKMPEAVSIFIMPPSFTELNRRLSGRGTDTAEVIKQRMDAALGEIARATEYDYIVVNDVLEDAVSDISHIILSERLRVARQKNIIDEVLEKC